MATPSATITPSKYVDSLPKERKDAVQKLRSLIRDELPKGFTETISHGMLSYVVPHSLYPQGYHADPSTPLPFISLASQKNFIALYHMGLYADEPLLAWFQSAYANLDIGKLDMGKSCIRFKKLDQIPHLLIGELVSKLTVKEWIKLYEASVRP